MRGDEREAEKAEAAETDGEIRDSADQKRL